METEFIEHLDQLYDAGYGEQFKEDNPNAFYRQLAEFENQYSNQKHETSFISHGETGSGKPNRITGHRSRNRNADPNQLACTANVQVLEIEILKTDLPTIKKQDNGTQY